MKHSHHHQKHSRLEPVLISPEMSSIIEKAHKHLTQLIKSCQHVLADKSSASWYNNIFIAQLLSQYAADCKHRLDGDLALFVPRQKAQA
jgi:hypothetical protein